MKCLGTTFVSKHGTESLVFRPREGMAFDGLVVEALEQVAEEFTLHPPPEVLRLFPTWTTELPNILRTQFQVFHAPATTSASAASKTSAAWSTYARRLASCNI